MENRKNEDDNLREEFYRNYVPPRSSFDWIGPLQTLDIFNKNFRDYLPSGSLEKLWLLTFWGILTVFEVFIYTQPLPQIKDAQGQWMGLQRTMNQSAQVSFAKSMMYHPVYILGILNYLFTNPGVAAEIASVMKKHMPADKLQIVQNRLDGISIDFYLALLGILNQYQDTLEDQGEIELFRSILVVLEFDMGVFDSTAGIMVLLLPYTQMTKYAEMLDFAAMLVEQVVDVPVYLTPKYILALDNLKVRDVYIPFLVRYACNMQQLSRVDSFVLFYIFFNTLTFDGIRCTKDELEITELYSFGCSETFATGFRTRYKTTFVIPFYDGSGFFKELSQSIKKDFMAKYIPKTIRLEDYF